MTSFWFSIYFVTATMFSNGVKLSRPEEVFVYQTKEMCEAVRTTEKLLVDVTPGYGIDPVCQEGTLPEKGERHQ